MHYKSLFRQRCVCTTLDFHAQANTDQEKTAQHPAPQSSSQNAPACARKPGKQSLQRSAAASTRIPSSSTRFLMHMGCWVSVELDPRHRRNV